MILQTLASTLLKQTVLDNPYTPLIPTPKQAVFLTLPVAEALYGGSAGGGKSVALLAAALQFVHVCGYRAMLLRRSYSDLNLPEALIPMSHAWLEGTDARWNGRLNEWTFPSGATLTFGYLDADADKYRYQGAAFQFIGFDELTQFQEAQYQYLFSRLRRTKDNDAPLRMRAATNPGGVGHEWVRRRFLDKKGDARVFIPAKLEDNPHLDGDAYDRALQQLDPVTRRQLRYGDWLAHADGLFPRSWFRYYRKRHDGYDLDDRTIDAKDCSRFATVDVAGTEQRSAGHDPDWTVIQTWDLAPAGQLLLVDQWRGRVTTPEVELAILKIARAAEVPWIGVEAAGLGLAVVQSLRRRGLAVRALKASGNKVIRSQAAQIRMEAGTIYFPSGTRWLTIWNQNYHSSPAAPTMIKSTPSATPPSGPNGAPGPCRCLLFSRDAQRSAPCDITHPDALRCASRLNDKVPVLRRQTLFHGIVAHTFDYAFNIGWRISNTFHWPLAQHFDAGWICSARSSRVAYPFNWITTFSTSNE